MINKTMGIGGDYADVGTALSAIINGGTPLSDHYYLRVLNNIENTTLVDSVAIMPTGFSITIDLCGYLVTSTVPIILLMNNITNYRGKVILKNGIIFFSSSELNLLRFVFCGDKIISLPSICDRLEISNLLISNHLVSPPSGIRVQRLLCIEEMDGITGDAWCIHTLLNIRIFCKYENDWGIYFSAPSVGGSGDYDLSVWYKRIENCAVYSAGDGVHFSTLSWEGRIKMCNVVCKANIAAFVGYDSYPATNFIDNCASNDNTLTDGVKTYTVVSGTVLNITDSDFLSVDPTKTDFLKISETSKLYKTGIVDISEWNTVDAWGRPRPDGYGLVSIGVHEPQFYNVTLTVRHQGMLKTKTKTVTL